MVQCADVYPCQEVLVYRGLLPDLSSLNASILISARCMAVVSVWGCVCMLVFLMLLPGPHLHAQPVTPIAITPVPLGVDAPVSAAGCSELLVNSGFEVEGLAWEPLTPGLPPELAHTYVTARVFAGTRALQLGLTADAPNEAITNGVYQTVTLPREGNPIVLGFHLLPRHEPNPGNDLQFVDVVDAGTGERITRLWAQLANRENWLFLQFDLTSLRGRTVQLVFGVTNDGTGGKTSLFVDNVSLLACGVEPAPTPVWTPTPTPTPALIDFVTVTPTPVDFVTVTPTPVDFVMGTPTPISPLPTPILIFPLTPAPLPAGCMENTLVNGSFENSIHENFGWIIGDDPVPPEITGEGIDGLRAMRLGNPPDSGRRSVVTYSSVRQLTTLPATALTARLRWSHRSHTQEPPNPNPGHYDDRQDVILLTPDLVTKRILYRDLRNTGFWQEESVDLTHFLGETFYVYFNAYNNGNGLRTWMFLDNVRLEICYTEPTPTPTPTDTPIPTPTPEAVGEVPVVVVTVVVDGTPAADVQVEIGELQLVAPQVDEVTGRALAETEAGTRTFITFVGEFLSRNWQWAIPWALLAILLFFRFIRP
jgi:hypothetical protein